MTVLVVEPFYGGSHKQLIDIVMRNCPMTKFELITQSSKKWHWRARSSALWFSNEIPLNSSETGEKYSHLFCSSVLNLCELIGLRPDLLSIRKEQKNGLNMTDFEINIFLLGLVTYLLVK